MIRRYVEAIRLALGTSPSAKEGSEHWNKWALAQADRIDPSMGDAFLKSMREEDDAEPKGNFDSDLSV